ncbi:alkaline phosphatase [Spirochaetia bacterium 38H-sp]|uniref:Alkaline phosphatase n=1 Tax=Rarispira pelagica TaxID=3141764 RepID=A0ABU9U8R8_9SPIR
MKKLSSILLIFIVLLLPLHAGGNQEKQTGSTPELHANRNLKYVFLFIGDGMALPQINAAEAYLMAKEEKDSPVKLSFSQFPVTGMCTTYSANSYITDSAAAATALASGRKTANGILNMDESKKTTFKTIAEFLHEKGFKIGIISTVSIDHATPAAFYAHQPSRGNYYEISLELAKSGFEFFAGGGLKDPEGKKSKKEGEKNNALEEAKKAGYKILNSIKDIEGLSKNDAEKVIVMNPVLSSSSLAMPYKIDRDKTSLNLADFTKKAIEFLENPKGFFIMVEGGKIDWACHANDAVAAIHDVLDFNSAVEAALDFAKIHPDETLIVVTGDHETGGLTMGFAGTRYSSAFSKLTKQKLSFEEFNKIIDKYKEKENLTVEDLLPVLKENFGLEDLSIREKDLLENAIHASINNATSQDEASYLLYGGYEPITVTITHIINNRAGLGWTSYSHTAVPVPVYAKGPGAEVFTGYYDNTEIPKRLSRLLDTNL